MMADTVARALEPLSLSCVPSSAEMAEVMRAYGPDTRTPTATSTAPCQARQESCKRSPVTGSVARRHLGQG